MTRLRSSVDSSAARVDKAALAAAWAVLAVAKALADLRVAKVAAVLRVVVPREAREAQHLRDSGSNTYP